MFFGKPRQKPKPPSVTINQRTITLVSLEKLGDQQKFKLNIKTDEVEFNYDYLDKHNLSFEELAEIVAGY